MDLEQNEPQKSGRRRSRSRPATKPAQATEVPGNNAMQNDMVDGGILGRASAEAVQDTDPMEKSMNEALEDVAAIEDNTRQFVTFNVGDEVFGLPIVEVQEIIRLPEVTRVPLSSANLQGLSNLRGKMLPIISLRRIFGFPDGEHDDATRVLVIQHESLLGFVVDQVSSVINVEAGQIEGVAGIKTTVNTSYLTGIIKNASGKMVMILNFARLMEAHFHVDGAGQNGQRTESGTSLEGAQSREETEDTDTLHFVSFTVESQEYAIPIEQVQEIVQIPENIAHVPNSASHVLGVISLRDKLLPLVSLRQLFGLPLQPLCEQNRIVVIHLPDDKERSMRVAVGIVTDTVNEVLRVHRNLVDLLPNVLAQDGSLVEITAIGRLDGGKRLVSFLSAEHLLSHNAVREAIAWSAKSGTQRDPSKNLNAGTDSGTGSDEDVQEQQGQGALSASIEADLEDEKQVVIFRLGDEEYGVPIEAVKEIVRVPDSLTRIPTAPSFVEGIINLRGSVLPVIDQRRRFGMEEIERSDRQRIMVFNALGTPTGFIVDSVSEVYKIAGASIERTPNVSRGRDNIISEVANLEKDKRMVLLLNVDKLLDTQETAELAGMAA